MAPHQEIEVKLRVDPQKLAEMRRCRWWRELEPVSRHSLHSVYFDTSDRQLHDRNISLRTRSDGKTIIQTVKMAQGPSDPVSRREWETLIPDPVPDPSLVIDPVLPQAFRNLTSADLEPVFAVDVKRETRRVESERAKIDVSSDEGAVSAGPEREGVHELELELVAGGLEELFAEARRLSDAVDGRLHARAKADIGHALSRADRRLWSRASKLNLAPDMTAGESFHLIVRNSFSHLTANDDCARLNLHVEGVHQCRIALRRLRSAFKIYGPLLRRKRIEPIEQEVRWLGNVLGMARDLDVLKTDLLEPAVEALGEREHLAPLVASLEARKAIAYAQVGEALAGARYRHLLIDLCALGHRDDLGKSGHGATGLDQPLADFASRALSRVHEKLLKRGDGFESLSKTERHEVRIALKKLRYAVDFFGGVFDAERKSKYFKKLARLQEDLGGTNDVVVAESMLARLIGVSEGDGAEPVAPTMSQGKLVFAAGSILGWHRRRAAEIDVRLIKDWHSFVRAKPFWLHEPSVPA
jgi:triphosphatase